MNGPCAQLTGGLPEWKQIETGASSVDGTEGKQQWMGACPNCLPETRTERLTGLQIVILHDTP
jgi:hypothetical protein